MKVSKKNGCWATSVLCLWIKESLIVIWNEFYYQIFWVVFREIHTRWLTSLTISSKFFSLDILISLISHGNRKSNVQCKTLCTH